MTLRAERFGAAFAIGTNQWTDRLSRRTIMRLPYRLPSMSQICSTTWEFCKHARLQLG